MTLSGLFFITKAARAQYTKCVLWILVYFAARFTMS